MKKFIVKIILYALLILIALEVIVRLFHLYTEDPPRYIDAYGVEKRIPKHSGYAVTGNRNQNFSEFDINNEGFNSHRNFKPTKEKFEIALIGDSFIEGFHQDYFNSIGKKIEDQLKHVEVYEYGYAGYDLANQMHLIYSYKADFDLIDQIVIYLNYESDLQRAEYVPNKDRIALLSSKLFKIRDNIKLLAYGSKIGILDPIKKLATGNAFTSEGGAYQSNDIKMETEEEKFKKALKYVDNFKNLVTLYGFDKSKTTILLDYQKTSPHFLNYLIANDIRCLDFSNTFEQSNKPTTLIYDWHWNDHGRELISQIIVNHLKATQSLLKKER